MCDEADGGLLVRHLYPSVVYAVKLAGSGRKFCNGPAGDRSAELSSEWGCAALSFGDASAHIFFCRHNTNSAFFPARDRISALRPCAGHRAPLDGLSLYGRLPAGFGGAIR